MHTIIIKTFFFLCDIIVYHLEAFRELIGIYGKYQQLYKYIRFIERTKTFSFQIILNIIIEMFFNFENNLNFIM